MFHAPTQGATQDQGARRPPTMAPHLQSPLRGIAGPVTTVHGEQWCCSNEQTVRGPWTMRGRLFSRAAYRAWGLVPRFPLGDGHAMVTPKAAFGRLCPSDR